ASGGLGLSRAAWESAHGPPVGADGERRAYGDGRLVVGFRDGNVASLELVWGDRPPILEEARIAGRGWLPQDARFVRTYVPTSAPGQPFVDVYASDSLGARFPDAPWRASPWTRGDPGRLIVGHRLTPDLPPTTTVASAGDLPGPAALTSAGPRRGARPGATPRMTMLLHLHVAPRPPGDPAGWPTSAGSTRLAAGCARGDDRRPDHQSEGLL